MRGCLPLTMARPLESGSCSPRMSVAIIFFTSFAESRSTPSTRRTARPSRATAATAFYTLQLANFAQAHTLVERRIHRQPTWSRITETEEMSNLSRGVRALNCSSHVTAEMRGFEWQHGQRESFRSRLRYYIWCFSVLFTGVLPLPVGFWNGCFEIFSFTHCIPTDAPQQRGVWRPRALFKFRFETKRQIAWNSRLHMFSCIAFVRGSYYSFHVGSIQLSFDRFVPLIARAIVLLPPAFAAKDISFLQSSPLSIAPTIAF